MLEVWLDLGQPRRTSPTRSTASPTASRPLLPALIEHHCGVGERGGFIQRLTEGTWSGHVLEHVVIELLNLAGMATGFGQDPQYLGALASTAWPVPRRATSRWRGWRWPKATAPDGRDQRRSVRPGRRAEAAVEAVKAKVEDCYPRPEHRGHRECRRPTATSRYMRLNSGNLVQTGLRRQPAAHLDRRDRLHQRHRRIDRQRQGADHVAARGLRHPPVPDGQVSPAAAEAWEAAEEMGVPVVVKPSDGNHGRGVLARADHARGQSMAAFAVAERHGSDVMVERFIRGERTPRAGGRRHGWWRPRAARPSGSRATASPTAANSIELQINSDPRRGRHRGLRRSVPRRRAPCRTCGRQGLGAESAPEAGRRVLIQRNGNLAIDCTDSVHPEVAHMVELAARVVGLDIAGIDLVGEDISKPLGPQGGAIVEVNAGPGLLMHLKPAVAAAPRWAARSATTCSPTTRKRRIPVVGVAGSRDNAVIARPWPGWSASAGAAPAWPAATACSSSAAASMRATAPTGKPATAC